MKRIILSFLLLTTILSGFSARRVLYIGDSITDGGWGRSGGSAKASKDRNHWDLNHVYGHSYMMLCAAYYQSQWPDAGWQFWNRGISGNTLYQVADRWQEDALSLAPDVISILIGTNDVGAYLDECKKTGKAFTVEGFDYKRWERKYRHLLDTTRSVLPKTELVLCTPFVGTSTGQVRMAITDSLAQMVRRMAVDYKATLVPFDHLFADLQKGQPTPKYWIWDGIHPTAAGHQRMAELWEGKSRNVMMAMVSAPAQNGIDQSLSRHNFLYAGQSKQQRMYMVKDGQVAWEWHNPQGRGEISDAVLLTDGHVLVAHQYGICEVTQDNKTLWKYDAPKGTEIHTIQPIGRKHVLFVQNGQPAKVVVMSIPDCQVVHEFQVPASKGVHGQFRNARLTSRGTLLLAHMGQGYVAEYSVQGNELTRWEMPSPWSVAEYANDRLLFVGRGLVREIDRSSGLCKTVREIKTADYGVKSPQKAVRLKNGNTIFNDWWNEWGKTPLDSLNPPVQAIEVDKDGKMVWQLCAWKDPDLGPSTTIQPLDQAVNRDRLFFGHFNGRTTRLMLGENQAIGEGRGIHPGRVAWIHSPGVATWDGHTGLWVEDRWNDQQKADAMVTEAIVQLTGEKTAKKGWTALFKHFNKEHGKGSRGYKKGEMIAVKLNLNNALTHRDTFELNSSPFVTLALVRSMVRDGGIREQDIVLCEPSRVITDSIYDKVHREFPQVRFIDNIGGDGREKCEYYPDQITYSQDNGKLARGLAKCIVDADYLINSSLLKTHVGPGVTLTSKNWYGATDIALRWQKNGHNNFSQDKRNGKPAYKTFVDWISHKHLGQKALFCLIDATYGSRHVNGAPFPKWQKEPFNNQWCCSIIVSQDEVACDAVGMDLIVSEWPEYPSLSFCDEYLVEAASLPHAPSGTVYKQDGQPLNKPLGLMEHCDKDRRYTKLEMIYKKL